MNTDTLVHLLIFQNVPHYFCMIKWMKNVNNFQIAKVQPQGVAQDLFGFQPVSAYRCLKESVDYGKKRVNQQNEVVNKQLLSLVIEGSTFSQYGAKLRSSHQRLYLKKAALKKICNFTVKHLCWILFLIKFQCRAIFKSTDFEEQLQATASKSLLNVTVLKQLSLEIEVPN